MAYTKFNLMAELGKLSQGKPTTAQPWLIAKLAIDEIRTTRNSNSITELERIFRSEDPRS